ncbi:MAG: prepilin peptidase [Vallitaleaceae bacterium]|nr:prepilin peptidase [Vallitaleaceae bacterium]
MNDGVLMKVVILGVTGIVFVFITIQLVIKSLKMFGRKIERLILFSIGLFLLNWFLLNMDVVSEAEFLEQYLCLFFLAVLSFFDFQDKSVPLGWVVAGGVCGLATMFLTHEQQLVQQLLVALIITGSMLLISKVTKEGIGCGDGYVLGLMSLFIGWKLAVGIFVLALFLSALFGILLIILKKAHKKSTLPFIPFLLVGTLLLVWI